MSYTAITTKFIGPTNKRGSRYKATTTASISNVAPSVTLPAALELSYTDNHIAVACALATKLGWAGVWVKGETNTGNIFVRLIMSADGMLPALAADDIAFIVDLPEAKPTAIEAIGTTGKGNTFPA